MVTERKQKLFAKLTVSVIATFSTPWPTLKINYRSSFIGFLTCLPLRVVYRVEPLVAATSGEGGIFLAGLFLVTDWCDW